MPVGHAGAIAGARRARNRQLPKSTTLSPERLEEQHKQAKKRQYLKQVLRRYDTNKTGMLEEDQLAKLMTDIDDSTPAGTEPTAEELSFVMKASDKSGEGGVTLDEVEYAINVWRVYTSRRSQLEASLQQFDKSGTGHLSKSELAEYLQHLNGGKMVTDEEVQWVMQEADIFGNGAINAQELVMATAAWYAHEDSQKKSKACTLL